MIAEKARKNYYYQKQNKWFMTNINFESILNSAQSPSLSLDNPRRLQFHSSYWQTLTHYKEKKALDAALQKHVLHFFQERYHFNDVDVFNRIWNTLAAKTWNPQKELTAGILRTLDDRFKQELIYHGEGINAPEQKSHSDQMVQKLVQALLHGGAFSPRMIEERAAKAIFILHDKELMQQFQQELQLELNHLATHPPKNEKEEIVWRGFLGNILALLPFCYPSDGDIINIPVLENGRCRQVAYDIEVIHLTYTEHCSPMIALGMTSKKDATAPPILSFIGTTIPSGSGFTATLLADFTPANSVGEIIYKRNEKKIKAWLETKKNVHMLGMSLGGAMTFHTLRDNHQIARVDAFVPPGLYANNWKRGIGTTCQVNIYCQPGDMVSQLGFWPTGDNVSLYTVFPHQKGVAENIISSHARAFTGCKKITVIKENPVTQNLSKRRYFITKLHQFLGPVIAFFPIRGLLWLHYIASVVNGAFWRCIQRAQRKN